MKKEENIKRGKKSRAAGLRFENLVRKDLESNGWIVDKWSNNVEFEKGGLANYGKLIKVKNKFRGKGIPMMLGAGFPDFIAFKRIEGNPPNLISLKTKTKFNHNLYEVFGVESKSNGTLDKKEKEKCKWYLDNKTFSKILIASRGDKRGSIVYKEFEKGGKGK